MPDGAPPPWLINMQRYGPPPSYANLKIPGLSAPIPDGATFGCGRTPCPFSAHRTGSCTVLCLVTPLRRRVCTWLKREIAEAGIAIKWPGAAGAAAAPLFCTVVQLRAALTAHARPRPRGICSSHQDVAIHHTSYPPLSAPPWRSRGNIPEYSGVSRCRRMIPSLPERSGASEAMDHGTGRQQKRAWTAACSLSGLSRPRPAHAHG